MLGLHNNFCKKKKKLETKIHFPWCIINEISVYIILVVMSQESLKIQA